jgi:hypothetical protein
MPQQLLQRSQIRPGPQQMRRKGMAQGVRRRSIRQPQRSPRPADSFLYQRLIESPTASTEEQRAIARDRPGAGLA